MVDADVGFPRSGLVPSAFAGAKIRHGQVLYAISASISPLRWFVWTRYNNHISDY